MNETVAINDEKSAPVSERDMANAIRALTMDAIQKANSGHPGMPMGMADVAAVLYNRFLKFDPAAPDWPDRDRFILSAGHGSMLLYSLLHLTGYPDIDIDQIRNFRQLGAKTAGHPEYGHAAGIETTTGPLGQGIANGVGMALAERLLNARNGDDICDHNTYVLAGDGCLMEGISHEAISLAGHLNLAKLIVLFDDNKISIDGATDLSVSDNQLQRFEASGWDTVRVDGHDMEAISGAIDAARTSGKPSLVACRTIIGFGAPNKQGTSAAHGAPLGEDEIAATRKALGWTAPAFEIPRPVLARWRATARRGQTARKAWEANVAAKPGGDTPRLGNPVDGDVAGNIAAAISEIKARFSGDAKAMATRVSSQLVLEKIIPAIPALIGGSADLTGSVGTHTSHHTPVGPGSFSGNYIHYGVREHAMAAAMNAMALHGGVLPYGGTFMAFADYCRPAIRLSALMRQRVIYVMTHDSIGLGEDGPTHQPVEHLASLRAIPNLNVFRPADAVECAECWQIALCNDKTPSILSLSRQGLPVMRNKHTDENLTARGGYVLRGGDGARDVTLIATGSEIQIAVDAAGMLADDGLHAAIVSLPCWELFAAQSATYRNEILGSAPRIAIEAGIDQGWSQWTGHNGTFIGMTGFGASAPASELYEHFGITAEAIAAAARVAISKARKSTYRE